MPKYSPAVQKKVEEKMKEFEAGKLVSGKSGAVVKSRKQAIAIALSEARAEGAKLPKYKPPKKT